MAAELILLNPMLSAQEALQRGLVNQVVPAERLEGTALDLANQLAKGPTLAYALAKGLLDHTWENPLERQLEEERRAITAASMTEDFKEGVRAFLSRRTAAFIGR